MEERLLGPDLMGLRVQAPSGQMQSLPGGGEGLQEQSPCPGAGVRRGCGHRRGVEPRRAQAGFLEEGVLSLSWKV